MVWSRRFAAALAASQIEYQPDWYDGSHPWSGSGVSEFSSDLGGGLAAAIATAAAATVVVAAVARAGSATCSMAK